jgi:hypothetical protein
MDVALIDRREASNVKRSCGISTNKTAVHESGRRLRKPQTD